jgi:diaminopimelate epimerase
VVLPFHKYEGLGNHFVLLDEAEVGDLDWPALAQALCARGTGVGADGLLAVVPAATAGSLGRMRMFNPDGSEDMCGNGARCVALHLAWRERLTDLEVTLDTPAGPQRGEVELAAGGAGRVRLTMGHPAFAPGEMPALLEGERAIDRDVEIAGMRLRISLVSMGTPHCVIFGDPPADPGFVRASRAIEECSLFPERVSVMWVSVRAPHRAGVRIWERAAGATEACGTGAAAVTVAGILTGRLASPVSVEMPGGRLAIEWLGEDAEVVQNGPARRVFGGEWRGTR